MFASLKKMAREGSLVVASLVAFVGAPSLAMASPQVGGRAPHGSPVSAGSPGASAPAPSTSGSTSTSTSSSKSGSGNDFKTQLLIGAGFAAMWIAGLPIGPGNVVPMSTTERIVRGVGGIGLLAGAAMALMAGFSAGFTPLGVVGILGGLAMAAFGLHFGLSAIWGKKNDGKLVVNHDPDPASSGNGANGTTTAGNNTNRPGNPGGGTTRVPLPSNRLPVPVRIGGNSHGSPVSSGTNVARNSSTRPLGPSSRVSISRAGTGNGDNAGVHH